MDIIVKLYSVFRQGRFEEEEMELAGGATVRDLITELDINVEEVGVVIINGEIGTYKRELNNGDKITLLPFISGG